MAPWALLPQHGHILRFSTRCFFQSGVLFRRCFVQAFLVFCVVRQLLGVPFSNVFSPGVFCSGVFFSRVHFSVFFCSSDVFFSRFVRPTKRGACLARFPHQRGGRAKAAYHDACLVGGDLRNDTAKITRMISYPPYRCC